MEINDAYSWESLEEKRGNNPLLPKSIRGLIIGKSNCGKTNLLMNLLLQHGWLDYNHLYVFGQSLHQTEYQVLKKAFEMSLSKEQIANLFANQHLVKKQGLSPMDILNAYNGECNGKIKADFFSDCTVIPDPSDLDKNEKNLLILDDCILGPQNKAEAYYTRGRHSNCDTFYISQNYFRLPRRSVRENANFFIIFPQDNKNLSHLHADHCSGDMNLNEFRKFCGSVWNAAEYSFVVIDLTSKKLNGKYRMNLDKFYIPKEESSSK